MPASAPEPWEIGLEQLRAEYARLVPWRSPTELEDMVLEAYSRCEETVRQWRKEQKKMTRIALVDLDGVVANRDAREAKAKEIAEEWLAAHRHGNAIFKEYDGPGVKDIYWQAFFNPEYVPLDTLIDGTTEALNVLYGHYGVVFLTSRPESMREATQAWLWQHDISIEHPQFGNFLFMKPPAFQFVKTPVWKAGMVQTLTTLYGASAVLFIDDRQENVEAVVEAWQNERVTLRTWSSLKRALAVRNWEE